MAKPESSKERNQRDFLAAFRITGTVKAAMDAAGITSRSTVGKWRREPEFLELMEDAARDFREWLEELAFSRLKQQKPNDSPLLLITMLNAHWPEKYRPGNALEDDKARDMAKQLRRLTATGTKNPQDAEVQEVIKTAGEIANGHKPD